MCTLLQVANRRPVDLISPLLVHEEQITSVRSTGDNSVALARFSCTVRGFSPLSAFFTRFPRFGPFGVRTAPRTRWSSSAMQHNVSATRCRRGPHKLQIIYPPLVVIALRAYLRRVSLHLHWLVPRGELDYSSMLSVPFALPRT